MSGGDRLEDVDPGFDGPRRVHWIVAMSTRPEHHSTIMAVSVPRCIRLPPQDVRKPEDTWSRAVPGCGDTNPVRFRTRIRIRHISDSDRLYVLDDDGWCELRSSISATTRDDLRIWHEYLTKHWHPDKGWTGDRWWFATEAQRLQDPLKHESSLRFRFEVDDWPAIGVVKLMSDATGHDQSRRTSTPRHSPASLADRRAHI